MVVQPVKTHSGSTIAVPLVLMQTLCSQEQFSEEQNCFERSAAFAFVHFFGWAIVLWTLGYSLIIPHEGATGKQRLMHLFNPPLLASFVGLAWGLLGGSDVLFSSTGKPPLKFLGEALLTVGRSAVTILTMLMASGEGVV